MSAKPPPSQPPDTSREARLAKALRENLARRKALVRARRGRGPAASEPSPAPVQEGAERPENDPNT